MFLRIRGSGVSLLHNYRDGRGHVCQRRLGLLRQDELHRLGDPAWQWEFRRRNPDVTVDWARLEEEAEEIAAQPVPERQRPRAERFREALARLMRLVQTEEELEQVAQALEDRRNPDEEKPPQPTGLQIAVELHREGRLEEAAEQYERVPRKCAERHYNLAEVRRAQGRFRDAMLHLMQGLMRDRSVAEALRWYSKRSTGRPMFGAEPPVEEVGPAKVSPWKPRPAGTEFWERHGALWDAKARRFLLAVYSRPSVRIKLMQAAASNVLRRKLLAPLAFEKVYRTALELSQNNEPIRWTGNPPPYPPLVDPDKPKSHRKAIRPK